MGDEDSLNAAEYFEFLEFVIDFHGKTFSNVADLLGDNGDTNRRISRHVGLLFVGCQRH